MGGRWSPAKGWHMTELERAKRRIAALERTVSRHVKWRDEAVRAALDMIHGGEQTAENGRKWWIDQFNQPAVVLSRIGTR